MSFRDSFQSPKFEDAPHLSDQLLFPNLAQGHNVWLATAFTPSYLFKLLRDLAATPEVEPGILTVVFYVPSDLNDRPKGIAYLKEYLGKYAQDEKAVQQLIFDAIQLFDEGTLRVLLAHTSSKSHLVKGCLGVITSNEIPADGAYESDYVAFVDAKAGDYNSPVKPLKSWTQGDYYPASDVLGKVAEVIHADKRNAFLVDENETVEWFEAIADWYEVNSEKSSNAYDNDLDNDADGLENEHFELEEYLRDTGDFDARTQGDEFHDSYEPYSFDLSGFNDYAVVVRAEEAEFGHIPPVPYEMQGFVGNALAECICGKKFLRAEGCAEVDWV